MPAEPTPAKTLSPYWVSTASGQAFDFEDPRPDMISAEAIGWQLSMECRWSGNVNFPYSVAQHSLIVAEAIPVAEWRIYGLLHDAGECFTRDQATPYKNWLQLIGGANVHGLERRILAAVFEHFDLPQPGDRAAQAVDIADARALATEYRDVVRGKVDGWSPSGARLPHTIRHMPQPEVFERYMQALGNYLHIAHQAGLKRSFINA